MLFVDYSLAFNMVMSATLIRKLLELGLSSHLCTWIMDSFQHWIQRKQRKWSSGSAEPTRFPSGLMKNVWKSFRTSSSWVSTYLSWSIHVTAAVKKAQQHLHFLWVLNKLDLHHNMLLSFYHSAIESTLKYCLTARYAWCTVADRRALQRVINTAQNHWYIWSGQLVLYVFFPLLKFVYLYILTPLWWLQFHCFTYTETTQIFNLISYTPFLPQWNNPCIWFQK